MKIGDLVKLSAAHGATSRAGLVIDLIEKKCWRSDQLGPRVDWSKIDPEPHAVILIRGDKLTIPLTDLTIVDEAR